MKIEGFKTYRHKSNPKEKMLHDTFIEQHVTEYGDDIDAIIFPPSDNNPFIPEDTLTYREKRIVLSTISWLGTQLGKHFLSQSGFVEK